MSEPVFTIRPASLELKLLFESCFSLSMIFREDLFLLSNDCIWISSGLNQNCIVEIITLLFKPEFFGSKVVDFF